MKKKTLSCASCTRKQVGINAFILSTVIENYNFLIFLFFCEKKTSFDIQITAVIQCNKFVEIRIIK